MGRLGKTTNLSCILVWRLQQKKATVYCDNGTHAYVLTSTGVKRVSLWDRKRIQALDESIHCCALVDINPAFIDTSYTIPSQHCSSRQSGGRNFSQSGSRNFLQTEERKDILYSHLEMG
jgi:hypothetical protein